MLGFIAKAAFSGVMVALVTVVARRHPGWGGLLAALPITSLLAIVLLWIDTRAPDRVADLSSGVLAFIVPSIPFFVVFPAMLRGGVNFWLALGTGVALLLALYAVSFWALPRLGVKL
jgi:hypothetical protein